MKGITRAIKIYGSRPALGKAIADPSSGRRGVSGEAIRKWELGRVPAERCRDVVTAVDKLAPGAVTLNDLRPDLWPDTPTKEAA